MLELINSILITFFEKLFSSLPAFFAGLIILLIGVIIASIIKHLLMTLFKFIKLDTLFSKVKLVKKDTLRIWEEVLTEILKWSMIIVFLVPTLEVWGLSKAVTVINQLLFYLPNVIVAVVIVFVGLIASNLAADLVKHSVRSLGIASANSLSVFTKGVIVFFTILIVLNQLGVAQDLVRILFTGIVAMLAIAGGLAFGLGGQETAREILEELKRRLR